MVSIADSGEIYKYLSKLDNWKNIENHHITKNYYFKNFNEAINFVNKVSEIAEKMNHHPDITVSYNIVEIKIFTHKVNSLTDKDFKLASAIDKIKMEEK